MLHPNGTTIISDIIPTFSWIWSYRFTFSLCRWRRRSFFSEKPKDHRTSDKKNPHFSNLFQVLHTRFVFQCPTLAPYYSLFSLLPSGIAENATPTMRRMSPIERISRTEKRTIGGTAEMSEAKKVLDFPRTFSSSFP